MSLTFAIIQIFKIIYLILLAYILLSWFPNVNWAKEPFNTIRRFSEIFFAPFRAIIPPLGMLDVSPIVCFLFLNFMEQLIIWVFRNLGF